jgi:hypothetical protein
MEAPKTRPISFKIIREYGAIEDERIYESPVEGERLDWDPIRMGAFLLGSDIATISDIHPCRIYGILIKNA